MNDQPSTNDRSASISEAETKLLEQLRANPFMAERFRQLMDRFELEVSQGMDAHQAEMMAIEEVQQLGQTMINQWASKTQATAVEEARWEDSSLIGNGKKNSSGIPPSGPSS